MKAFAPLVIALSIASHAAEPRPSSAAPGQPRAASAAYKHDGAIGGATSSIATSATYQNRVGFVGQLYEVTSVTLSGAATVNETATLQLGATAVLNDATTLIPAASSIAWSVDSGPLSINTGGLATAGAVYQNTSTVARGTYAGLSATLALTVLDVSLDNFGIYAADGIEDYWQVQYFGENNPLAAPTLDPDGDGHTNLFEFTAGLVPTDSNSRFRLRIEAVAGQPLQKRLVFSPIVAGRTYAVLFQNSFYSPQLLLGNFSQSQAGDERTVTDTDATSISRFYHVVITK